MIFQNNLQDQNVLSLNFLKFRNGAENKNISDLGCSRACIAYYWHCMHFAAPKPARSLQKKKLQFHLIAGNVNSSSGQKHINFNSKNELKKKKSTEPH